MSSTKVSDMSVSGEIENLEYEITFVKENFEAWQRWTKIDHKRYIESKEKMHDYEEQLYQLRKRLEKLLIIRPMSDEERQRAKEKYEANHSFDEYGNYGENNPPVGHSFGQPLRKKQVWRTCVSCGGPAYNDFCGFCQEEL